MATNITKDQLSPEQRELQRKHQQLLEDISVRGLTTAEAAEYRRLKAKIDAAKWRGSTRQSMNAAAERRAECAASLRRSIARGEIELGNLRDVDNDYEQRILAKKMIGLTELAKGSLLQG